jgi:hypothetical protein
VDTAFTYQGQLVTSSGPVTDTCDFQFMLYNALIGGFPVGGVQTVTETAVTDGVFSVQLDFGSSHFTGQARWLEIGVRCPAGSGDYDTMSPRQALTPVPYALYALGAPWSGLASVPADLLDGDDDTTYTSGIGLHLSGTTFGITDTYRLPQGCSDGEIARWNGTAWTCTDDDVGSGWALTGNAGTTYGPDFIGTTDSVSLTVKVSDTVALRIAPGAGDGTPNIIGGYSGNLIIDTVRGGTIAGGGSSGYINRVTGSYATVGGGRGNQVIDWYATIGGGENNQSTKYATVGGGYSNNAADWYATVGGGYGNDAAYYATVGGGRDNQSAGDYATVGGGGGNDATALHATVGGGSGNNATGGSATVGGGHWNDATAHYATVGGGENNDATDWWATVGGGQDNQATGQNATVPGGRDNVAGGVYSFAAGRRAKANSDGCFVWGDATDADVSCDNDNRWVARASGGVYFYTNASLTSGMYLSAGGSAWNAVSDRARKGNLAPVDTQLLLERLSEIPITTWNYKAQDPSILHIGPMAQDFNALVEGLGGEGEDYINSLDADGVALAAIQGLHAQAQDQQAQIEALEEENAVLEARLDALEAAVLDGASAASTPWTDLLARLWPILGLLAVAGSVMWGKRQ